MVQVTLSWSGEGGDVKIAGEFNSWSPSETQQDGSNRTYTVDLQPGKYTYKWVVDGNWLVDSNQPTDTDESGNVNNVRIVEAEDASTSSQSQQESQKSQIGEEGDEESRGGSEETSGEMSGDSDSWERVSVGDCAATSSQENVAVIEESEAVVEETEVVVEVKQAPEKEEDDSNIEKVEKMEAEDSPADDSPAVLTKSDSMGMITKEGFVMTGVKKEKPVIKIERMFSSSKSLESEISEEAGKVVVDSKYVVNYFDTPHYNLLKQGIWCKQIHDKWILRRLSENKVQTISSEEEINQCLQTAIGKEESLPDLLKNTLTKKIEFKGAVKKWKMDKIEVERVQEGDLTTVTLRTEDCMIDGLKKIYSLASSLKLEKLKLI